MCGGGGGTKKKQEPLPPGPTGPGYQVTSTGQIRNASSAATTDTMTTFGSELGGK